MTRFLSTFLDPLRAISTVLSTTLVVFGIYAAGPWYVDAVEATFAQVEFNYVSQRVPAALFLLAGLVNLYGVFLRKPKVRKLGMLFVALSYFFATALRLITIGFTPFFWIFLLALGLIASIVRIAMTKEENEAAIISGYRRRAQSLSGDGEDEPLARYDTSRYRDS